jgi:hypothetical protein
LFGHPRRCVGSAAARGQTVVLRQHPPRMSKSLFIHYIKRFAMTAASRTNPAVNKHLQNSRDTQ